MVDSDCTAKLSEGRLAPTRPLVLISACLLGERVRYDGELKPDLLVLHSLGPFVDWQRVCPESDSGLPTPRPPMNRVGPLGSPRLISSTGEDLTEQILRFTRKKLAEIERYELCGYVCKARSPSSGLVGVDLYSRSGKVRQAGAGLFTGAFMDRFPLIPIEQNDRLSDPQLMASFAERVFARRRWLDLVSEGLSREGLVDFHMAHKFLLLAHGQAGLSELDWIVGVGGDLPVERLFAAYELTFMAALARPATRGGTVEALQQMAGFVKNLLSRKRRAELMEAIEGYRCGRRSLSLPLDLLSRHAAHFGLPFLSRQVLLSPYPAALMLPVR
ncbi:MAG: DUF1722 domain-containing protein [Deltaproteobacteria bacterium]|nr:DUF1722 domain-containing protein [Deltaproteobacteria bacterium]